MADIPECRLQFHQPQFYQVDVDYFGPLPVKLGHGIVNRYGCVFTCLTMHTIHIEIAHSLDIDLLINSLRRFIARRGRPMKIFSDNATNFAAANKELCKSLQNLNSNTIQQFCSHHDTEWSFNPPTASHMEGVWKRMICNIKKKSGILFLESKLLMMKAVFYYRSGIHHPFPTLCPCLILQHFSGASNS